MGILKHGPNGHLSGRVGKIVYYNLNGQNVSREIGVKTKDWSSAQIGVRSKTSVSSKLFTHFKPFFNVGFSIVTKDTTMNPFNMMVKINRPKMWTGDDLIVDYSKLELSRGVLQPGENLQASATNQTIDFAWEAKDKMPWPESTDLAMMIAYFPEKERVVVKIGGNARNSGGDQLQLPPSLKGLHAETYIGFVAADRKQVSDSTYLGSLEIPIA
ncbi:MAG: DUF6266 family protein [Pedobacter sp.]